MFRSFFVALHIKHKLAYYVNCALLIFQNTKNLTKLNTKKHISETFVKTDLAVINDGLCFVFNNVHTTNYFIHVVTLYKFFLLKLFTTVKHNSENKIFF